MEYLNHKLKIARLFDKDLTLPTKKEDCREWFISISSDLSPENLCCDGEMSKKDTRQKYQSIMESWHYLEEIYGEKVPVEEAELWE